MRVLAATRDDHERAKHLRVLMVMVYVVAIIAAVTVSAQTPRKKKGADTKPDYRRVTLKTKDGINLRAYYFPSENEKEAITVLLVHEWQGQASPYAKLVLALQKAGCAILIPDYRGHGASKEYVTARGDTRTFNIAQMSKRDVENIVNFDLEKAKAFLKEENDEGKLNLNALVVIGVREGCVIASRWAQRDWSFPSVGRMKQGQDVKALIFISPEKQIKGIGIDPPLLDPNLVRLPIMIIAGNTSPEAAEARRVAKRLEAKKKVIGRGKVTGFDLEMLDTTLSGPALVNDVAKVIPAIAGFVKTQVVVSDDENPWVQRD